MCNYFMVEPWSQNNYSPKQKKTKITNSAIGTISANFQKHFILLVKKTKIGLGIRV